MQKYCIDYRNGGMGNTVLSHVLYASHQVDFDIGSLFSAEGNAHRISRFNHTNLTAQHLIEYPAVDCQCILQIVCTGWEEILRLKLSYSKWMKKVPTLSTYRDFFVSKITNDDLHLWLEFYNNIKDPSWPICSDISDIKNLPLWIQEEIEHTWREPSRSIGSDYELLEFLCTTYYDSFMEPMVQHLPSADIYRLGQYFNGEFGSLMDVSRKMGWQWNESRSDAFYHGMLGANQKYLDWLKSLQKNYQDTINTNELSWDLQLWETSVLLAKIFFDLGKNPRTVKWKNLNCFFESKSLKLNQLIGT